MVVPNNHGFSYKKWSFWGVLGIPPFKENRIFRNIICLLQTTPTLFATLCQPSISIRIGKKIAIRDSPSYEYTPLASLSLHPRYIYVHIFINTYTSIYIYIFLYIYKILYIYVIYIYIHNWEGSRYMFIGFGDVSGCLQIFHDFSGCFFFPGCFSGSGFSKARKNTHPR